MPADTIPTAEAARRAWRRRVLRVGGIIQGCFAIFWLVRGGLAIGNQLGLTMAVALGGGALVVLIHGIRTTAGLAPRPTGADAQRLERSITVATVVELVAAFVLPAIVIAAGRSDLTLPSIALTIGPIVLALTLSGTELVVTTGLTAGALLLFSAANGFSLLASNKLEPIVE